MFRTCLNFLIAIQFELLVSDSPSLLSLLCCFQSVAGFLSLVPRLKPSLSLLFRWHEEGVYFAHLMKPWYELWLQKFSVITCGWPCMLNMRWRMYVMDIPTTIHYRIRVCLSRLSGARSGSPRYGRSIQREAAYSIRLIYTVHCGKWSRFGIILPYTHIK